MQRLQRSPPVFDHHAGSASTTTGINDGGSCGCSGCGRMMRIAPRRVAAPHRHEPGRCFVHSRSARNDTRSLAPALRSVPSGCWTRSSPRGHEEARMGHGAIRLIRSHPEHPHDPPSLMSDGAPTHDSLGCGRHGPGGGGGFGRERRSARPRSAARRRRAAAASAPAPAPRPRGRSAPAPPARPGRLPCRAAAPRSWRRTARGRG